MRDPMAWSDRKPKSSLRPQAILGSEFGNQLVDLQQVFSGLPTRTFHQRMIQILGAKATNLALIDEILSPSVRSSVEVEVPAGFAVPFDFYDAFMNQPLPLDGGSKTLAQIVEAKLDAAGLLDPSKFHSICRARPVLADIRATIQKAPVAENLVNLIMAKVMTDASSPLWPLG